MNLDELEATLRRWMTASKFLDPSRLIWERSDAFPRLCVTVRIGTRAYHVGADTPGNGREDYLGCTAANADGTGNDLSEGRFNAATWAAILADIVGYEMLAGGTSGDSRPAGGAPA
jgi:hypothetical protein